MEDELEQDTSGQDVQKPDMGKNNPQGFKMAAAMSDRPAAKASLKEKLETLKAQVGGAAGKEENLKTKNKEEAL